MKNYRYDVVITESGHCYPRLHFCVQTEHEYGCYGTSKEHGYTYKEACIKVAKYYQSLANTWLSRGERD